MSIKNVIICGLGALGLTYANKLKEICNLKILVDEERFKKFKKNPPIFNDKALSLDYILPTENFDADLIIISTKSNALSSVINNLNNFVSKNTIIISLLNGVSSEEEIEKVFVQAKVLKSFFIGHSAINIENRFYQDGVGKIVVEQNQDLEEFFSKNNINYEVSNDIVYSQWVKLGVNIVLNQLSAINNLTVGDLRNSEGFSLIAKKLLSEVIEVGKKIGVSEFDNYETEVFSSINLIADDGITSMLQDIRKRKKTEVEIFSGEIIKLGKKYNIKTPYNEDIYNKIKLIEKDF